MTTSPITRRLAQFVVQPELAVPESVLTTAALQVADTMGCALAGLAEPASRIAAAWVEQLQAQTQARVWGRALGGPPADVALANGTAAHSLDFDDSLPTMRGHPGAVLVPAALAVGESVSSSGREVLDALVVGLEVGGLLGRLVGEGHYLRGWHMTATIGAFTSTAVAARLMRLSVDQTRMAWGLAASQSSGLVRNFGTMTKPFHTGHAARTGVLSAWMAREGFTAAPDIFDGEPSFVHTYGAGDGGNAQVLLAALGTSWAAQEPGIYVKRWPCCYCSHRAIAGLQELIAEEGVEAADIEAIEIGFLPGSDAGLIASNPKTGLEARFSVEYAASVTALDGDLTFDSFTDECVRRPEVQAFMPKVRRYRIDGEGIWSGVTGYTELAVRTRRGRYERRIERTPGSPAWPLTGDQHRAKFIDNSARAIGPDGAGALYERLVGLARESSVADVLREVGP